MLVVKDDGEICGSEAESLSQASWPSSPKSSKSASTGSAPCLLGSPSIPPIIRLIPKKESCDESTSGGGVHLGLGVVVWCVRALRGAPRCSEVLRGTQRSTTVVYVFRPQGAHLLTIVCCTNLLRASDVRLCYNCIARIALLAQNFAERTDKHWEPPSNSQSCCKCRCTIVIFTRNSCCGGDPAVENPEQS